MFQIIPLNKNNSKLVSDIQNLKHACNSIVRTLSKQSPLHKESAILSRFLYKYDKKFRGDIGYRYFKKVNTALRKYLSLSFLKDTQNFIDILPDKNETEYIPTRQMLEYILVRLMSFSKIMYRIVLCSKQAAIFYLDRIKRGESHWMCLMPYALLSRIWSMALVLLQHSCNWYRQLYPFQNKLTLKGLNFLPDQYNLPLNLEEWLDMKHINEAQRFEWSQKLVINFDSLIEEDNEGDLCENILKYVDNINKKKKHGKEEPEIQLQLPNFNISNNKNQHTSLISTDFGEAVSRESFQLLSKDLPSILKNPSVGKVRQNHSLKNVVDRDSLKEFIENEETLRNDSNPKSLTSHLSFMQWQALKNTLLKLDSALINKRKFERKFQKVWEEKCTAYN